jgi:hypothetical protein
MIINLAPNLQLSIVNHAGSYSSEYTYEIGFPSKEIPELEPYKVGDSDPRESVYAQVPLAVIALIISKYHTTHHHTV